MTQPSSQTPTRRQSILLAALTCFSESDIESVTISDICAQSNASVGSIYHHFSNKEGIILGLLADGLEAHLHSLEAAMNKANNDAKECVEAVVGSLIEWVESNNQWAAFIYANLNRSGAKSSEPILAINRRYQQVIETRFEPLARSGQIQALPMECWSSLILAPTHDFARKWLRGETETSLGDMREILVEAAWQVLRPRPLPSA